MTIASQPSNLSLSLARLSQDDDLTQNEVMTYQEVRQADGVVGVLPQPLDRDGGVAPHLPADKQADGSHKL